MSKSRRDPPHYSYCTRVLLYVKDNTELPALGNSNYCKEQWTIFSAVKTSIKHILFLKKIQRNIQHLPLQILTVITRVRSSMVTKSLKAQQGNKHSVSQVQVKCPQNGRSSTAQEMSSFFCAFKDHETFYKDKGQCWASMNFKHGNNATVARTGTTKRCYGCSFNTVFPGQREWKTEF